MKTWMKSIAIVVICLHLNACVAVIAGAAVGGALLVHDRRSVGTIIDDESIEFSGYNAVRKQHPGATHRFVIESHNGLVLLTGQTKDPKVKESAFQILSRMDNVRRVYNFMDVGPLIHSKQVTHDLWLGSKIKAQMALNLSVDPTRINIVVENNVVYLMGIVSEQEAKKATDVARYYPGVGRVVQLFELLAKP